MFHFINVLIVYCRYIFETKEIKKTDSKGKNKDSKGENIPESKTIARLQVGSSSFLWLLLLPPFPTNAWKLLYEIVFPYYAI